MKKRQGNVPNCAAWSATGGLRRRDFAWWSRGKLVDLKGATTESNQTKQDRGIFCGGLDRRLDRSISTRGNVGHGLDAVELASFSWAERQPLALRTARVCRSRNGFQCGPPLPDRLVDRHSSQGTRLEIPAGLHALVTFLPSSAVDLNSNGINPVQAAELRARLSAFAEDWESHGMSVYDNYDAAKSRF